VIVKQVSSKKATGSFKGLANYLLDVKNGSKKVASFHFENCNFDSVELNLKEIQNTTNFNQIANSDKVLHLVVSFREDEYPSKEILKEIEDELIKSIGMQEHQRLVVAHNNTNNFHIHIAINKIHPKTKRIVDVWQSKRKLAKKAFELEEKFNLKRDQKNKQDKEQCVKDFEIHSGIKSFTNWIKEEVLDDILKLLKREDATFKELQELLAQSNLEFKPRGNGFVIAHKSRKLFVKSSAIHRELSKANLKKRFKDIELIDIKTKLKREFGMPKHNLWQEYLEYSNSLKEKKREQLSKAKIQNQEAKEAIKTKYNLLIQKTKSDPFIIPSVKREIYKNLFQNRANEYKSLSFEYKKIRDKIHKATNRISYKEFLIKKSLEGDEMALRVLRANKTKLEPDEKAILGREDYKIFIDKNPTITKRGFVVYKIGNTKIIDKGSSLKVTIDNDETAIKEMLLMSIKKYGKRLDITGDIEFKQRVIAVNEKYNLGIEFKDKLMREISKASKIGQSRGGIEL